MSAWPIFRLFLLCQICIWCVARHALPDPTDRTAAAVAMWISAIGYVVCGAVEIVGKRRNSEAV